MIVESRWRVVLDPNASRDAREAAWRGLLARIRAPVLFQLRRRIEGWRLTEDLADEVCDEVRRRFAEHGVREDRTRLRECIEHELVAYLKERKVKGELDEEFERDWASSLFAEALLAFKRLHPDWHRLFLKAFDRPEGEPPLGAEQLSQRLQQPVQEVARRLEKGRDELRRLFANEIGQTVADPACVDDEVARLMPRAKALFGQ